VLNDLRETAEGGDDELEDSIWDGILNLLYCGFYSSRMLYCRTLSCLFSLMHTAAAIVHVFKF